MLIQIGADLNGKQCLLFEVLVGVEIALRKGFGIITGRPHDDLAEATDGNGGIRGGRKGKDCGAGGSDQQSIHTDLRDEGPEASDACHMPQRGMGATVCLKVGGRLPDVGEG